MSESNPQQRVYWVSGNDFVEKQTEDIKREFKRSKPKPRDWKMGFQGEKKRGRIEAMKRLGL